MNRVEKLYCLRGKKKSNADPTSVSSGSKQRNDAKPAFHLSLSRCAFVSAGAGGLEYGLAATPHLRVSLSSALYAYPCSSQCVAAWMYYFLQDKALVVVVEFPYHLLASF
jgi:hypothetical protein